MMMLHTAIHWPEMADSSLWPMAVQHSTYLHNNVPNHTTSLSPNDLFTRMRFDTNKFHDLHVWGCLVYVLDKNISDGNQLPRWRPHSHHGVYMETSPLHSSSVPLVLNLSTGAITPQFHVVFDDWFGSIAVSPDDLPDFNSDHVPRRLVTAVSSFFLMTMMTNLHQTPVTLMLLTCLPPVDKPFPMPWQPPPLQLHCPLLN